MTLNKEAPIKKEAVAKKQLAPLTAIDLITQNQNLENQLYTQGRKTTKLWLILLSISIIANIFLIWLSFFYFPRSEFIPTSNAAAICNIAPVNEPFIHHQVVANFAAEAIIGIYTYDHVNYRRELTEVTNKYFNQKYRDEFMTAFGNSKNLRDVIENYFIVSSSTAGKPPVIIKNGMKNGAYFWRVQVPINVYYTVGKKTIEEKILATVDVVRTEPTRINPNGIAVDTINTRPLM